MASPRERLSEIPSFEHGEGTVITVRRHWFVLLRDVVYLFIMYLLPLIAYVFLVNLPAITAGTAAEATVPNFSLSPGLLLFLVALWTFLMWIRLFSVWTDYYLDTWIVTTKRIIDIDQEGFFRRSVGSFPIIRIQDVTFTYHGLISSILDFGTIHVETAGSNTNEFKIEDIPNPKGLRDVINKELDRVLESQERPSQM